MSITPDSLRNKRKNELKEIALDLGLSTKGLRSDLEERIRIHLENASNDKTSESTSSKTPRRSFRKKSISTIRVKSRKDNIPSSPNGGRNSSDEENQSVSSENESKQVIKRTNLFNKHINNQLTFESSQQDIIITQTTSELETTETVNLRGLPSDNVFKVNTFLIQLRKNISNSTTFCKAVTCLELLVFLYCAIEWSLKIASIPIPNLGSEESYNYDLHVPDIFIFIDWHRFWRPLISFIFYLVLLPLGFSYIFNFEPHRNLYSPLTFSVAQYAIFMVSVSNFDWAEDVRDFIPDNLIYMGAGTGAIFALYESILANSDTT